MNRAMEREIHRYGAVDTSHQEGQFVDSEDPCSSGRNGGYGGVSGSDGRQAGENGDDALMEDRFYLEHVGHVTLTLSDTHLLWHSVEDDNKKLVTIIPLRRFLDMPMCCRYES